MVTCFWGDGRRGYLYYKEENASCGFAPKPVIICNEYIYITYNIIYRRNATMAFALSGTCTRRVTFLLTPRQIECIPKKL